MKEDHKEKLEQAKDKAKELFDKAKAPNPVTRMAKSAGDATLSAMKRNPIDTAALGVTAIGFGLINGQLGDLNEADGFFLINPGSDDMGGF